MAIGIIVWDRKYTSLFLSIYQSTDNRWLCQLRQEIISFGATFWWPLGAISRTDCVCTCLIWTLGFATFKGYLDASNHISTRSSWKIEHRVLQVFGYSYVTRCWKWLLAPGECIGILFLFGWGKVYWRYSDRRWYPLVSRRFCYKELSSTKTYIITHAVLLDAGGLDIRLLTCFTSAHFRS